METELPVPTSEVSVDWRRTLTLLMLAGLSGFILYLAPHGAYFPFPSSLTEVPETLGGIMLQGILLLAVIVGSFTATSLIASAASVLSPRPLNWDWHELSVLTFIVMGALGWWQWIHIPWRHPPSDEDFHIAEGRLYLWRDQDEGHASNVLFFEQHDDNVLTRRALCGYEPSFGPLLEYRVLDQYRVECIWSSASLAPAGSRQVVLFESGSRDSRANPHEIRQRQLWRREIARRSVADGDGSDASRCRLEAKPAAVRCSDRLRLLPGGAESKGWPVPKKWHVENSARTEITINRKTYVCFATEVDGARLDAGVSRLPAVIIVRLDSAQDQPLPIAYVYDTDASCERIEATSVGARPVYRWSDEVARATRESHELLRFSFKSSTPGKA